MSKPTRTEIIEFIESRQESHKVQRNGRVQLDECPICGSDTGFSIVVDAAEHNEPGYWTCMSDKHPDPASGGYRTLQRILDGKPVTQTNRKRMSKKRTVSLDPPKPIEDKMDDMRQALLDNEPVMQWCLDHWGWTPEMVANMDVGFSGKASDVDVKVLADNTKERARIDSWIIWPHRWLDGSVARYVRRMAAPYTETYKRTYINNPAGVDDSKICYGMEDIQRWLDDPDLDSKLLVVEGEPDRCTLKGVLGADAYVCAMPGARRLCDVAIQMMLQASVNEHEEPRIIVIPDLNADGDDLLQEIVRRVGARRLGAVHVPKAHGVKDITDWCKSVGMNRDKILELICNPDTVETPNYRPLAAICNELSDMKISRSDGFRFHVPEIDNLFASAYYEIPHLPSGEISVLLGPRKHRKSTLSLLGGLMSSLNGHSGVYACFEMASRQVAEIAFRAYMGHDPKDMRQFRNFASNIRDAKFFIQGLEVKELRNMNWFADNIRCGVEDHGIKWIIVDSLSRLEGARDEERGGAAAWAQMLKELAAECGLHVVMLAHDTPEKDNMEYRKPINIQSIRRYKDVLQIVDHGMCIQSMEGPCFDPTPTDEALFQFSLSRTLRAGGKVELKWTNEGLRYAPGAFTAKTEEGGSWG